MNALSLDSRLHLMDTFDYTFIDDTIHFLLLLLIDRYISLTKILSNAAIILVNLLYILTSNSNWSYKMYLYRFINKYNTAIIE